MADYLDSYAARFDQSVRDKDGNVVTLSMANKAADNAVEHKGGNIVVPHRGNGGKGKN